MKEHKITSLNERQQCRDKISVWFGAAENYYHPVKEVIQNAIDEIKSNFDSGEILIKLHDDNRTVSVTDTGRGMPLPEVDDEGVPYWRLLFLKLFAGSKYDNNDTGDETGGTNGVGNTVTCYTSDFFQCNAYYKGKIYTIAFQNGGEILQELKEIGETEEHGTTITFKLSDEVYTETRFDEYELEEIVKRFASCSDSVKFTYMYKDIIKTYQYDSIENYFDEITTNLTCKKMIGYEKEFDYENEKNKISLVFATSSEPTKETFLNYVYLKEGGSIDDGIIRGVRNYLNDYLKTTKEKHLLSDKDIIDSLSYVCKFKSTKVSFSNQTKFSTGKKLYNKIANEYTKEIMEIMFLEKRQDFEKLLKHILEVRKFNEKSSTSIKRLKKSLSEKVDNVINRIPFLDDCKNHGPDSELFICEGLSAKGSITLSRDASFQAVIAMKGKVLNCLKTDLPTIFQSKVIVDLIKVLGCGIATDKNYKDLGGFDINKLRYGKILITTDADEDGLQIACLILTMIYRLMPELIFQGKVFIVKTPLFENKLKDDSVIYTFSSEEQSELIKNNNNIRNTARAKGLGELDAEYMAKVGVNPETRFVEKVTISTIEKMNNAFEHWMGPQIGYRKQYLESHLKEYIDEI